MIDTPRSNTAIVRVALLSRWSWPTFSGVDLALTGCPQVIDELDFAEDKVDVLKQRVYSAFPKPFSQSSWSEFWRAVILCPSLELDGNKVLHTLKQVALTSLPHGHGGHMRSRAIAHGVDLLCISLSLSASVCLSVCRVCLCLCACVYPCVSEL